MQGSSDVIVTVDTGGRIGYISPAVTHVFGHRRGAPGGHWAAPQLVHPDGPGPAGRGDRPVPGRRGPVPGGQVPDPGPAADAMLDGRSSLWQHTESTLTRHRGGLVFTCRDVSDRVALQQQLAYNAYHDSLTGLPNRALFADRLEQALAQRLADALPVAVLFLDLDWFKEVNDTAGHAAGDALLVEAAARLRGSVRAGDTVARFGGDEFAALSTHRPGRAPGPGGGRAAARRADPALPDRRPPVRGRRLDRGGVLARGEHRGGADAGGGPGHV